MIEKIVLDYLKEKMDIPVFMEIPSNPPVSFVLIEKTGSGLVNHIYNATIAIQSYSDSLYNAAQLNDDVKKVMLGNGHSYDDGIVSTMHVARCDLNSDYNATDTTNKRYRYQAVFDLIHY